jgi:hypothetical protein
MLNEKVRLVRMKHACAERLLNKSAKAFTTAASPNIACAVHRRHERKAYRSGKRV